MTDNIVVAKEPHPSRRRLRIWPQSWFHPAPFQRRQPKMLFIFPLRPYKFRVLDDLELQAHRERGNAPSYLSMQTGGLRASCNLYA